MPNSKQIVYLSQAQYAELIANGSITVDGVTVQYNENDIYVTPQAEPVTDVRVAGTSVAANGIANIPYGAGLNTADAYGLHIYSDSGSIRVVNPGNDEFKAGGRMGKPIAPGQQHYATFYGLAKAAGHDEKDSTEPLGTYTPEAKGAIQSMLGVSDLIATEENNLIASKAYKVGDVFTANGKLYKATAAIAVDGAIIPTVEGEEITGANCEETSVGEGFPHDVQVNGESVVADGIANIPIASGNIYGVVKVNDAGAGGIQKQNGQLAILTAQIVEAKAGSNYYKPITPKNQHESTFYGLAKAAGADEKDSTLPVGQYTDTAKTAIRTMLGATSNNVIAIQDTQPTDTDTKIWLPETAPEGVEVPTMEDLGDYVKFENYATYATPGVVRVGGTGISINPNNGEIYTMPANLTQIKAASANYAQIVPSHQHESVFYGLAKAAGDTTQSASDNAVGTYTDEAKSAIRGMLGAVGTEDYATTAAAGIVRIDTNQGLYMNGANHTIAINAASSAELKAGIAAQKPITPIRQHEAVFYGLAKAAGDTSQSISSNVVGTYTDEAKEAIKSMLGIDLTTLAAEVEIPLVETVTGTDVTINGQPNVRYNCGEVSTITINPPAAGSIDVIFTSGTSVAVLTLPSTVKMPAWFDATALETDTIYEILITDGVYGSVMTWPV